MHNYSFYIYFSVCVFLRYISSSLQCGTASSQTTVTLFYKIIGIPVSERENRSKDFDPAVVKLMELLLLASLKAELPVC